MADIASTNAIETVVEASTKTEATTGAGIVEAELDSLAL